MSPPAKGPHLTFWDAIERFPPYYVRMLAKERLRALSDAEVAIGSAMSIDRVREIKTMTDWNLVKIGEFLAFCSGCNFDPTSATDRHRVYEYERICKKRSTMPFLYLRKHPKWETEFLPLLKIAASLQKSSPA
ncbi:MAG: hypothetical protein KKA68_21265 [Gammaproteobacteria bacterium]|nr:hypothetical protein [Gammaproteobacteria bacterium]